MSEKVYVNICDKRKCPGPVYAVKKGDTLYSIAQKYHCRVRTLLDLNPFVARRRNLRARLQGTGKSRLPAVCSKRRRYIRRYPEKCFDEF